MTIIESNAVSSQKVMSAETLQVGKQIHIQSISVTVKINHCVHCGQLAPGS